jgi:hypothetical protein
MASLTGFFESQQAKAVQLVLQRQAEMLVSVAVLARPPASQHFS